MFQILKKPLWIFQKIESKIPLKNPLEPNFALFPLLSSKIPVESAFPKYLKIPQNSATNPTDLSFTKILL